MRILPDWGRPLDRGSTQVFAAFEQDCQVLALPDTLAIASEPDGRPAFHLAAVRALGLGSGVRGYGRLDFELQLATEAAKDAPSIRAVPAHRGWVRLRSLMLEVPDALTAPAPLHCSGLGLARVTLPLAAEGVDFVERALSDGALPVLALVDLEIAGVAPRINGQAVVDLARFRATFAGGSMAPATLRDRLRIDPAGLGVELQGVSADLPVGVVADAVADHLRAHLCAGPLAPAAETGLGLVIARTDIASGTATLDLSNTVVATRAFTLSLDPFAAARALTADTGGLAMLVTRSTSSPVQSGRHRVVVDTSVRRPLVGPLGLAASLAFPPRPPARTHEVRRDFDVPADSASVVQQVQLAPDELLSWTITAFAFWPTRDGRGFERLAGPELRGEASQVLLRPDAFPLAFFDVEAEPALLALARVEVRLEGEREDAHVHAETTLAVEAPRCSLALPADAVNAVLAADLLSLDGGLRLALPPRPAEDWRIELNEAAGYGPRAIEIIVALPPDVQVAAVEVQAEDAPADSDPDVYSFTAASPKRVHRWFCRDPFRPGFMWRWRGKTAFSAPIREIDRLELTPEITLT